MNKKLYINLFWIAFCIGFAYLFFFPSDDESLIRKRLQELVERGAVTGPEHPFERLAKGREISSYFTDPVTVTVLSKEGDDRTETISQRDLAQKIALYRGYFIKAEASFGRVSVEQHGNKAIAEITVTGYAEGSEEDESYKERADFSIELENFGGEWFIRRIEYRGDNR